MNLKEMLKVADQIVFTKTGQHLDDLQEAVLRGTLQRQKYKQIAKDLDCSESSVKNAGAQLWEILSEELGENVNKSNVLSAIERLQNSNVLTEVVVTGVVSDSFNTCGETRQSPDIPNSQQHNNRETSNSQQTPTLHHDLSEMPELGAFYSRTPELHTLTTWIVQHRCRLIALTGISGIGKTTLAAKLVQQIKDEFEYVIWCSLNASPIFPEFQDRLIDFFYQSEKLDSPASNQKLLPPIKYLQKYRCLVILDNVHNLFSSGELAGKYKPDCEECRSFFKDIEKLSHQSCFLLIGWEQPREFLQVKSQDTPIRTLQLAGLDIAAAREIVGDSGLEAIDNYSALISRYQGNPLYLKSVASLIQELGEGVTELLSDGLLWPEDLKDILHQQFSRLSEPEKQVISLLAGESQPVNLTKLLENAKMRSSDLLSALQSLSRRCFIEKPNNNYSLSPVMKQYINSHN